MTIDQMRNIILVIDDDATTINFVIDSLKTEGFEVVVARNGEMGLKRAKFSRPDLILLDVRMPGIDGFETCRCLKADETTRDIPVIFMTALSDVEDKVKGFAIGGVDYITKPIQEEELLARVRTHLTLQQIQRELQQKNVQLELKIADHKEAKERIERLNRLKEDLLRPSSLEKKLKRITDGVVTIFDADFARIWIINPGDLCDSGCFHARVTEGPHVCRYRDRCLYLMVSSGRYTHIDGEVHQRVPFGCYKIGRVAAGEDPKFITNDVTHDPRVHNHDWARKLDLVSFAGYRLLSTTGKPIGVLALFSKHSISPEEDALLESLANTTAQVIQTSRAEEALRNSEALYHSLVENLPQNIFCKDLDGRFTFVNQHFCAIEGKPLEEIIGKTDFDLHPPELAKKYRNDDQHIIETGEIFDVVEEHQPLGGEKFYVQVIKTPIYDSKGQVIGIQGIFWDITDRKRAEAELRRAKDAAEAANRAKSIFLANMSHELRTPLSAILGFAQLMAHSQNLDAEQQENLNVISRSGEHLLTLINQVLDLSKVEAGRITLNEIDFDLYCLLDGLENMFRLRTEKKGLYLLFERTDDVPQYVRTDEMKLRQVLINLLNNALKFTEEGGVTVRIENCRLNIEHCQKTALDPQSLRPGSGQASIVNPFDVAQDRLQFSISDTGSGVAPDELDSLFEAFTQTKAGQKIQEGTGLGLIISQKFVQLMGGGITVKSEVGHGTTFTFDIQVDVVEAGEIESARPTRKVMAIEPGQPRYRMLIVDDEPNNRKLLVSLLTPFGFELQEVSNGQEAIKIWGTWEPHLIWMDMRMPVMDGYEATKYIKSEILNSKSEIQTIIIAVTASSFEEERAVILEAGCDDFLRKPFREQEVFDLLAKHLGVRFVYEEPEQGRKVAGVQEHVPKGVLTPEAIATLPDELRTGLRQAVEVIDMERANSLIEQIRQQNEPLAEGLAELVKNYRFDTLQELFEEIE